ncbi:MAG: hypothetical protein V1913_08095, partial [Fibrobacterota bacterium]
SLLRLVCHSGLDPESIIRWWIPAFAGMTEKASLPFDTPQLAAGRIHFASQLPILFNICANVVFPAPLGPAMIYRFGVCWKAMSEYKIA